MNTPAMERSVIPSTSFSTASAFTILSSFRCFGSGLNNRTPWIFSLLFTWSIVFNTSSSSASAGRRNFSYATPSVSQRFVAPLSYAMSSSLSPIRIIPSVGVIFCAFKISTFALISSLIEAFTSFPNSNFAFSCCFPFILYFLRTFPVYPSLSHWIYRIRLFTSANIRSAFASCILPAGICQMIKLFCFSSVFH